MPLGVVEAEVVSEAETQKNTFKSILILEIFAAVVLKGQKSKMWMLLSVLQVIVYVPVYKVDFPANLQIYLTELRKIAEF